jgi:hypothetical protein
MQTCGDRTGRGFESLLEGWISNGFPAFWQINAARFLHDIDLLCFQTKNEEGEVSAKQETRTNLR